MRVTEPFTDPLEALRERAGLLREWQLFLEEWPVLICPVSAEVPFPDHLDTQSEAAFDRVYEAQLTACDGTGVCSTRSRRIVIREFGELGRSVDGR